VTVNVRLEPMGFRPKERIARASVTSTGAVRVVRDVDSEIPSESDREELLNFPAVRAVDWGV